MLKSTTVSEPFHLVQKQFFCMVESWASCFESVPISTYMWTGEGKEQGKNASYFQLVDNGFSEVLFFCLCHCL